MQSKTQLRVKKIPQHSFFVGICQCKYLIAYSLMPSNQDFLGGFFVNFIQLCHFTITPKSKIDPKIDQYKTTQVRSKFDHFSLTYTCFLIISSNLFLKYDTYIFIIQKRKAKIFQTWPTNFIDCRSANEQNLNISTNK